MKRILFLTAGSDTGSEHSLFNLMSSLEQEDYEISVLTRYDDYQLLHPIPCRQYYSEESFLKGRLIVHRIADRMFYRGKYFPFTRFFRHILHVTQPGLIYCNSLTMPEYFDYFLQAGIPYIIHGHSLQQYLYAFSYPLLEKRIKGACALVSSSEAQKEAMQNLVRGIDPLVIYPPINLDELNPGNDSTTAVRNQWGIPPGSTVWAMASTYLNYNKDPDRFIEIGKRILDRNEDDVFFVWIGGSPGLTAMRLAVSKLEKYGLTRHFIFTGDCSHHEYIRYLDACDGLLLVSLEESFSIVSAEAVAMGKPVLAFDCGGVKEIITPDNGCLVKPFSYGQMAETACRMEIHNYNLEKMRMSVSRFDLKKQSESWVQMMITLLKNIQGY